MSGNAGTRCFSGFPSGRNGGSRTPRAFTQRCLRPSRLPFRHVPVNRRCPRWRPGLGVHLASCQALPTRDLDDRCGHFGRDRSIEHAGDDVVLVQLVIGDAARDGFVRGDLHFFRDLPSAAVERATKDPRERQDVDLVRIVRTSGCPDANVRAGFLRCRVGWLAGQARLLRLELAR